MNWRNIRNIDFARQALKDNFLFRIEGTDGSVSYSTGYLELYDEVVYIWRDPSYCIGKISDFQSVYFININEILF